MRRTVLAAVAASGLTVMLAGTALTEENWGAYQVGDTRSGYTYAKAETRAIQDDDFENPAMLWVDTGGELWEEVDGEAGKSCASCHGDAEETMAEVGATYPVYFEPWKKLMNVEQRINYCRTENMKAKAWKWESRELLAMTAFVRHQSRGKPVAVKIDGPAEPFYEKGKEFYYQRRGQLDMACKNCHEDNAGNMIRANLLSQGHSNGFPTYRLKWQKVGSLHRRFRGCNKQVRATPYKAGSDEYVNLELYLANRGRSLPVETPAVRN
jgi:sulfur-oxidizing protein SoxA